ncbi:Nnf1-domain-containing protein [Rhypophila decipiens]|uniref:Nnf1-domain-containing protein n=1 Tax=Rhypophila decipiens TaxID=261697 RepID=A0AAN6YL01_9PEZI|nr:Nnf1-domain-containing protein [Rhypophila decipiens]
MPSQQVQPPVTATGESELHQHQGDEMDVDTTPATTSTSNPNPNPQQTNPTRVTRSTSKEPAGESSQNEQPQQPAQEAAEPSEEPDSPLLPNKHIAVTPGPRASRLQEAFAGSLRKTLEKINLKNFAACYPTVAQGAPGTLEFVQRTMVTRLGEQCNREFDSVLQKRNAVAKLNELESLVSDAARRKAELEASGVKTPIPPHTLPAKTILAAHLAPHLASQQSQLNAKLQTVQSHNALLFDEIQAQRAEMERILAAVEQVLADVGGANELLDAVVGDLATETRAVEAEMSGMEVRTRT